VKHQVRSANVLEYCRQLRHGISGGGFDILGSHYAFGSRHRLDEIS
jgi:hypothetical protein